ncbi:MAG: hypothetical protein CL489_10695 [Acidobacteria bacterium]|nr:hypothetical protein [Acidobacteriota bacterium]|tara:strand:+ start:3767 stop:4009 length:243 start_codon:yes stop_codon:yes gene_type:complete
MDEIVYSLTGLYWATQKPEGFRSTLAEDLLCACCERGIEAAKAGDVDQVEDVLLGLRNVTSLTEVANLTIAKCFAILNQY